MPSPHETAYPRLKQSPSAKELTDLYTPSAGELALASQLTRSTGARIFFLVMLKTFQRLGYFTTLHKVPPSIAEHIALLFGAHYGALEWEAYDLSGMRARHMDSIRKHFDVKPFAEAAQILLARTVRLAAHSKEDSSDIINIAIEELVRHRFELPGFTTLLNETKRGKAEVNRLLYERVCLALGKEKCSLIDQLLDSDQPNRRSLWQRIKKDDGAPTLNYLRQLVSRLGWLKSLDLAGLDIFDAVPQAKVEHFALEARSLDAARMTEMEPRKRYTLAAALIRTSIARCLDDLGEILIKRIRKAHRLAQNALAEYVLGHQVQTDRLVSTLYRLLLTLSAQTSDGERLAAIDEIIGTEAEDLIESCRVYSAYADNNYLPFLWRFCKTHRQAFYTVFDVIELVSTSSDSEMIRSLAFLKRHRSSKKEWILLEDDSLQGYSSHARSTSMLSLGWVTDKWWKLLTGFDQRDSKVRQVNRRYFELCVFTTLAHELQSGDVAIPGSNRFSDYRNQLVSPEEYENAVTEYCEQVGLPSEKASLIENLRELLTKAAATADGAFPDNEYLRIEDGEPILSRLEKRAEPESLKLVEQLLAERLPSVNILDAIADTERWLHWTRSFGPVSGHEAKIDDDVLRYITTVFCYGCNLGPSQTARSMSDVDRRQIGWINQRHITEDHLDQAITAVINGYNRFLLPTLWGSGQSASADGTKWDLYEHNLLSEYHIRYGGYGGIGYYHVSDTYIALFSHFIPCGVWEAVYILDGLLKNRSDIQPDTLHSDTHGQSAPVFGLAYLLGIKLMPRIRNWKDLHFFRPEKKAVYDHIDSLFTETVNWTLISEHMDEMLRVTVSIKAGKLLPSTILRKLGTYSRNNRLYLAFRELGRVIRTAFLLNYISNIELRREILGAINKSEGFNNFAQWAAFGGQRVIAENDRDEQRKLIKYNHLVANCLIFHNVFAMTQALHEMTRQGLPINDEVLRRLSPYITERINRFGDYRLDMGREMPALNYHLSILPFSLTPPE